MNGTYANHKYLKIIIILVTCLFMTFSLVGCSKTPEKKKSKTTTKKSKTTEVIEMSVKELNDVVNDSSKTKKYADKTIKVTGYYFIDIDLQNDTATKFIQDNAVDAQYAVVIDDKDKISEDYIGGETLELEGTLGEKDSMTVFVANKIVIDGNEIGATEKTNDEETSNDKGTVKVIKIQDLLDNKEYLLGTEFKLCGKLVRDKADDGSYTVYITDEKTNARFDMGENGELIDKINNGVTDVIVTIGYYKSEGVGTNTNVQEQVQVLNIQDKTDSIKVKEKKLSTDKKYSKVVTVQELSSNFKKYKGKLITLEGYGGLVGDYDNNHLPVSYKLGTETLDDDGIRIFSKHVNEYQVNYYFRDGHKYTFKGKPKESKEGYIYLEVDEN